MKLLIVEDDPEISEMLRLIQPMTGQKPAVCLNLCLMILCCLI
jgi:DNA-binding response OmpR family regulator